MAMKYRRWRLILALSLLISSAILYLFDYAVFGNLHEIITFMLGEIAFLPLEVLLVTLVIDRLLRYMERRNRLEKLNMVIGAFFVEVGTSLLVYLSDMDPEIEGIRSNLKVTSRWSGEEFSRVAGSLVEYSFKVDISRVDLEHLHIILSRERGFFLRLIENPALMEHESFTDLLLAIFHLTEELARRPSFEDLPRSDLAHLKIDIERTYGRLAREWLDYMKSLKTSYPYLFHLAMRTNPFDQTASVVVMEEGGKN
jgi:hypothetical protein